MDAEIVVLAREAIGLLGSIVSIVRVVLVLRTSAKKYHTRTKKNRS